MVTNEKIDSIISECKKAGHDIRVRDIAYALLCRFISDKQVVYKSIFGASTNGTEADVYDQSKSMAFLKNFIKDVEPSATKGRRKKESDISFDENKAAMLSLIEETKQKYDNGEIEAKDYLKITSEVRVRLNDKFAVRDTNQEQWVIVQQKYDEEVCPHCHHEIARKPISKEEAIKMYNLVDKD